MKYCKCIFTLLFWLMLLPFISAGYAQTSSSINMVKTTLRDTIREVTIDLTGTKQIIRGFGGATVFLPITLSDTDMDKLYGQAEGEIGLSLLRIRVASDDNPVWRALELSNAQKAIARGAFIIASPWSPPVRMKTNNSLIGGSLKINCYANYATYLNDFATYMANNHSPLYAISIQNEPDISVHYESCDWTASELRDFLKHNGSAIQATKVIAPESFHFNAGISDSLLLDEGAAANVSIIGGHIYGDGLKADPLANTMGKEVWMTEHLNTDTSWDAVLGTAKEIHDCIAKAGFNAYLWWYVKRYYGLLDEKGIVSKRGYIVSNYAKFIRPGYHRVATSNENPNPDTYISAYKGDKAVIIALNMSDSSCAVQLKFVNGIVSSITPYITSPMNNLTKEASILIQSNAFRYTLTPKSVTTFVGE